MAANFFFFFFWRQLGMGFRGLKMCRNCIVIMFFHFYMWIYIIWNCLTMFNSSNVILKTQMHSHSFSNKLLLQNMYLIWLLMASCSLWCEAIKALNRVNYRISLKIQILVCKNRNFSKETKTLLHNISFF